MGIEWLMAPWQGLGLDGVWIFLMTLLVCLSAGLVGLFLVLRGMSMVGDAISHSVLPGLVLGFLLVGSLDSPWLLVGAGVSGLLSVLLIEWLVANSPIKYDASIGISFTSFFALGLVLISLFVKGGADLDANCVLMGRLEYLPGASGVRLGALKVPLPVINLLVLLVIEVGLLVIFFRLLWVVSFDAIAARTLGISGRWVTLGHLAVTSLVVVACFESVGAILVIGLLILPGATAYLLTRRLGVMVCWVVGLAFFSSLGGWYVAAWVGSSLGATVVVVAGLGFFLALTWQNSVGRWRRKML